VNYRRDEVAAELPDGNRKAGKQENRKTGKQENRKTGKQDDAFGERAKADGANTDSSGMPAKMTMAVRQRID
jgi:hypothetical protein